jgi:hypothetical protein
MSSRPFHGVAYQSLREYAEVPCRTNKSVDPPSLSLFSAASEDSDVAFESSVDGDTILRTAINGEIPDRQLVERCLLRKLDSRMSILVLIYVLNFVSQVAT